MPLNKPQDKDSLLDATLNVTITLFVAPITVYILWFYIHNNQPLSTSTSDWADFGNFLGGILSPVVSFFALLWLIRSVRTQKQELSETRDELKKTNEAHEKAAKHQETTKLIEDCRNFIELIKSDITEAFSHPSQYKIAFGKKLTRIAPTTSHTLQDLFGEALKHNHVDIYRDLEDEYKTNLLHPTAVKLCMMVDAFKKWEELHGESICFAAEYHKRDCSFFAGFLKQMRLLPDEQAIYLTTQK